MLRRGNPQCNSPEVPATSHPFFLVKQILNDIDLLSQQQERTTNSLSILEDKIQEISKMINELESAIGSQVNLSCDFREASAHHFLSVISLNSRCIPAFSSAERLAILSDFIPKQYAISKHILGVAAVSEALFRLHTGACNMDAAIFGFASMLHDVGKSALSLEVLQNKENFRENHEEIMKKHTVFGYGILAGSSSQVEKIGAEIALTHHERWNGSGYPRSLACEKIPLSGRIVGIADTFDAMTVPGFFNNKPRPALSPEQIRSVFIKNRGVLFDPILVDTLLEHSDKFLSWHQEANAQATLITSTFQRYPG